MNQIVTDQPRPYVSVQLSHRFIGDSKVWVIKAKLPGTPNVIFVKRFDDGRQALQCAQDLMNVIGGSHDAAE
jgi:hypothetical protein